MSDDQWKPGDIGVEHGVGYIANGDGVLSYFDDGGDPIPAPEHVCPTGLRAIPIDVCEQAASELRDYKNVPDLGVVAALLDQLADILDPPAPQPEPEWVTLDAGNGVTWQPTAGFYKSCSGLRNNPGNSADIRVINGVLVAAIEAQLADGKELRP